MKFVPFRAASMRTVLINPRHVVAALEDAPFETTLRMTQGTTITVKSSVSAVLDALNGVEE